MDNGRAPERATMIVEARYWPMNVRMTDASVFRAPQSIAIGGKIAVVASERPHPLDHYADSARNILHLEVGRVAHLAAAAKAPQDWRLSRLFFRVWGVGVLSSYAVFETTTLDAAQIDDKCAAAVEVVDSLLPHLEDLLTELGRRGAIKLGADLLFGVPMVLRRLGRHTALGSYRYSNYLFFGSSDALQRALNFYGVHPQQDRILSADTPLYLRWAHYLWDTSGEEAAITTSRLEDRVSMDLLAMSEAIAYDNGSECNRGFLDAILDRALAGDLDAEKLRETTLFHHRLLLDVRLWRSLLDQREQALHQRVSGVLLLAAGKENFEHSDEMLRYAVDSLDVREQRDADRILAIALGVFTALTTFSAAADLNALLRDDGTTELRAVLMSILQGPFSLRTLLLAMATAGAAVAVMFLAADRAVRRRAKRSIAGIGERARRIIRPLARFRQRGRPTSAA
jgi:hypothetical protein